MVVTRDIDQFLASADIGRLVIERGRAADAKDPDRMVACHVPGSSDRHGIFEGTIEEFGAYVREHHYNNPVYGLQRHAVSNILTDFDGPDRARSESYHIAMHELRLDAGRQVTLIGGRYLDRLQRHDRRWLLVERRVVYDWSFSTDEDIRVAAESQQTRPEQRPHHQTDRSSHMSEDRDRRLEQALSRGEIEQVLNLRARAADHRDVDLALSCYHDGATEEHEGFTGTAETFLKEVSLTAGENSPIHMMWHFVSNIVVEFDGDDSARVESYHIAAVDHEVDDKPRSLSLIGGRYLDDFERRDGRWAIAHRRVVFDWSRSESEPVAYWDLMGHDTTKLAMGDFGPNDPIYAEFGAVRGT